MRLLANKSPSSQSYGFSSSHIRMWELDHKESWVPKNWCFRIMLLEKTLKSPLDSKAFKPVSPKGNQPFIGRTDGEVETLILWRADTLDKTLMLGDWGQEEKGATEDDMVGRHHQLSGHESKQTLGHSEGQGSLVCCSLWGLRVGHGLATEWQWWVILASSGNWL